VVHEEERARWLLYSTGGSAGGVSEAYVSTSRDLRAWDVVGVCARFPDLPGRDWVATESLTVMRHPRSGRWIMLGNFQYAVSDDPLDFTGSEVHAYFENTTNGVTDLGRLGFAGEIIESGGRWYRSGVLGAADAWVLGFHEIEWVPGGAFRIRQPSVVRWLL
jgi:hypothetical protein